MARSPDSPPPLQSNDYDSEVASTSSPSSFGRFDSGLFSDDIEDHHIAGPSSPESTFTNPSSFGSVAALLSDPSSSLSPHHRGAGRQPASSSSAQADLVSLGVRAHNEESIPTATASASAATDAFHAGMRLARLAWLETDPDIDTLRCSNSTLDWTFQPVTSIPLHRTPPAYFQDDCSTYCCARCGTTLALQDELISKAFSGRDGKAFLFFSVLNTKTGPKEDRQLLTGLHTVADLSCANCQRSVGWSYLRAFEASQRYKEGKFILERATLHKTNNWNLEA